jgi:hypothetical protein
MRNRLGGFITKEVTTFINWFKWVFADADAPGRPVGTPVIKNVVFSILTLVFCVAFLKVVYLMSVVVYHNVHTPASNTNVTFKSMSSTSAQVAVQDQTAAQDQTAVQNQAMDNYTFQIPDIPQGWQYIFLGGMGILAGLSGIKKVAEFKYLGRRGDSDSNGNGNGNGNGNSHDPTTAPSDKPVGDA